MRKQEEVFLFPQEKGLVKLIIIPVDARHAAQKIERTWLILLHGQRVRRLSSRFDALCVLFIY